MSTAPVPAVATEPEIAPRPVFCVVEHAYRDLAVADGACRGTFTFAGETVDLGPEPDWVGSSDLPLADVGACVENKTVAIGHLHLRQRPGIDEPIFRDNLILEEEPGDD